jgi:predicted ester cyclase
MATMIELAEAFFVSCETGGGWEECKTYCSSDASFECQNTVLSDIKTLSAYAEWMKGLLVVLTDGSYEVKSFAADEARKNVIAYGVFTGTHLNGGPIAPTGKTAKTDYVYVMQFEGAKIVHMTKIWNSGYALKQLGWR